MAGELDPAHRTLVFFDLSYLQKINGDLRGPVDFWVKAGSVFRISENFSAEASLNHFCRHETSLFNPSILNFNELIGRIWAGRDGLRAGFGLGVFIGGTPGFDGMAVFSLEASRVLLPEISLWGEIKWVDFSELVYEAEASVALFPGTDLILSEIKPYRLPSTTHLGVRFRSADGRAKILDGFELSAGTYPFYDVYKLHIDGAFRLALLEEPSRRLLFDVSFRSPVLAGSKFLGEFWPDRMMYLISAEYEKPVGRLWASWYGRYFADMPVDKSESFQASVATGLALKNQPDFNLLHEPLRFEIRAGYDLKFDYDFALNLGLNATDTRAAARPGVETRLEATGKRRVVEARIFIDFGRKILLRPFIGVRRITPLAGESRSDGSFKRTLTAGIAFFKWFKGS